MGEHNPPLTLLAPTTLVTKTTRASRVKPKRMALEEANDQLHEAQTTLSTIISTVAELEEKLKDLTQQYESAMEEKVKCQEDADATAATISLANRLVNGLSSENVRWKKTVEEFKVQSSNLPGDVLLVSSFMSYAGCFTILYNYAYRIKIITIIYCLLRCTLNNFI